MNLIGMFKLAVYNMPYKIRERLSNGKLDFNRCMTNFELKTEKCDANGYTPANPALLYVLKDLKIETKDAILDMGCGKGKAMHYMTKYPFSKIGGVDLCEELIEIARNNFRYLRLLNRVELHCCDAGEFRCLDDYNYIFFYNPFPRRVMEKVLGNIKDSFENKGRKIYFIYQNSVDDDLFEECNWIVHVKDYKYDLCDKPIRLFSTREDYVKEYK